MRLASICVASFASFMSLQADDEVTRMIIEAEEMDLKNFRSLEFAPASGGKVIALSQGSGIAETQAAVPHEAYYDIVTAYYDQNDGESVYKIFLDGMLIDAWSARRDLGEARPRPTNYVRHYTRQVKIKPGQKIEYLAYQNGGEVGSLDAFALMLSAEAPTRHSMRWADDGTISSLLLSGVEHAAEPHGRVQLRCFNGESIRGWNMIDAIDQNGVIKVVEDKLGIGEMYFRVEAYRHHLLFRLIGFEKIPKADDGLNVRVSIPLSRPVNVVSLDGCAVASLAESQLQLDWIELGERSYYPGGTFAIYADGTDEQKTAALKEIQALHQGIEVVENRTLKVKRRR